MLIIITITIIEYCYDNQHLFVHYHRKYHTGNFQYSIVRYILTVAQKGHSMTYLFKVVFCKLTFYQIRIFVNIDFVNSVILQFLCSDSNNA